MICNMMNALALNFVFTSMNVYQECPDYLLMSTESTQYRRFFVVITSTFVLLGPALQTRRVRVPLTAL